MVNDRYKNVSCKKITLSLSPAWRLQDLIKKLSASAFCIRSTEETIYLTSNQLRATTMSLSQRNIHHVVIFLPISMPIQIINYQGNCSQISSIKKNDDVRCEFNHFNIMMCTLIVNLWMQFLCELWKIAFSWYQPVTSRECDLIFV